MLQAVTRSRVWPLAILAAASLLILLRCRYGVDFTDEAQYAAQAYSPVVGGVPFVNDLFVQQSLSVLLTPLIWVYCKTVGSSDGIILFMRVLWWAFASLTCIILYRRGKRMIPAPLAALVAATALLFIPFYIPAPSYNSFGLLLLALGLCGQIDLSRRLLWLGLAGIVYPPFLVAPALLLAAELPKGAPERGRAFRLGLLFSAGLLGAVALAALLFGPRGLVDSLRFSAQLNTFGAGAKLAGARRYLADLASCAARLAWGSRALPDHDLVTCVAFLWGAILAARPLAGPWRKLWAIGVVCGALSGWASSNGLINVAIGAFPAFVIALWLFAEVLRTRRLAPVAALVLAAICVSMLSDDFRHSYRELPPLDLAARVDSGPYLGLMTTAEKASFLRAIQSDVNRFTDAAGGIFFAYSFPAGYLLSSRVPATRVLDFPSLPLNGTARELVAPRIPTDYPYWSVRVKYLPGYGPVSGDPSIELLFFGRDRYTLIIDRPEYAIYRKSF